MSSRRAPIRHTVASRFVIHRASAARTGQPIIRITTPATMGLFILPDGSIIARGTRVGLAGIDDHGITPEQVEALRRLHAGTGELLTALECRSGSCHCPDHLRDHR